MMKAPGLLSICHVHYYHYRPNETPLADAMNNLCQYATIRYRKFSQLLIMTTTTESPNTAEKDKNSTTEQLLTCNLCFRVLLFLPGPTF